MKKILLIYFVLSHVNFLYSQDLKQEEKNLEDLTIDFTQANYEKVEQELPKWIDKIDVKGGSYGQFKENYCWQVDKSSSYGEGRIDLFLNREEISDGLALTISFDNQETTDFSIQLFSENDESLALDLFGNAAKNARLERSDTFIIPLKKYKKAKKISIRRIKGQLRIYGLVAFPVITEVEKLPNHLLVEFANLLGEKLPQAKQAMVSEDNVDNNIVIRNEGNLDDVNDIAMSQLSKSDYPSYKAIYDYSTLKPVRLCASGMCDRFLRKIYFHLFNDKRVFSTRSDNYDNFAIKNSRGSIRAILDGRYKLGFGSRPLTVAQHEKFFQENNFSIIEIPIALDAIELVVNESNKLDSISLSELDAMFSDTRLGKYPSDINSWEDIPRSKLIGEIEISGGLLSSNTANFFRKIVLSGGKYKNKYVARRMAEARGVRAFVSNNKNGIGFIQTYDLRVPNIKRLAISSSRGGNAYRVNESSIYSNRYPLTRKLYLYLAYESVDQIPNGVREFLNIIFSKEGQTAIAYTGPFPLNIHSIKESRKLLKLP